MINSYIEEKSDVKKIQMIFDAKVAANICPDCGGSLTRESGCVCCFHCGFAICM